MPNYKPVLIIVGSVLKPLLDDAGKPVVYDAEAYPDGPPEGCCCGCPDCCACETYTWTVAGVSGGGDCANANGDYTAPKTAACSWDGDNGLIAGLLTEDLDVECGYLLTIGPTLTGASQAFYKSSRVGWDCNGCNTMTLDHTTGTCVGWPETIEVCCADEPLMMMAAPGAAKEPAPILSLEETESLFGASGADDPTLLGNRIAALTKAVGFPPCGKCNARKVWLNRAHQWVRDSFKSN
jgi:hypothetical protein